MTLFESLKAETKSSHDELEARLDLLSPEMTLDDYQKVLAKFWGVYYPLEKLIQKSELKELYQGRAKTELLKRDLKFLGLSDDTIRELPLCMNLSPKDQSELLGTLYVLEGSTLGAMILSKHFHLRFNLDALNGLSFFTGNGENTVKMWQEWRKISENIAKNANLQSSQIVGQAKKTFKELQSWMCSE